MDPKGGITNTSAKSIVTISDSLFLAATSVSGASILLGMKTGVEVTPLQQPLSQAVYVLHSKCGSVVLPQG